jgi:hypothetical protein
LPRVVNLYAENIEARTNFLFLNQTNVLFKDLNVGVENTLIKKYMQVQMTDEASDRNIVLNSAYERIPAYALWTPVDIARQ